MLFRSSLPVLQGDAFRPTLVARADSLRSLTTDDWMQPLRRVPWLVLQSRADETMPFAAMEQFVGHLAQRRTDMQLVALDSITHQQTVRYREPLRQALPWIRRQWGRP